MWVRKACTWLWPRAEANAETLRGCRGSYSTLEMSKTRLCLTRAAVWVVPHVSLAPHLMRALYTSPGHHRPLQKLSIEANTDTSTQCHMG